MGKRILATFLAAFMLAGVLSVAVFAEENVVFINVIAGSNAYDGLSADSAKTSFGSNNIGEGAMSVLGEAGGTMVISGKCRPGFNYTFPEMTGTLTITAVWDGVDYRNYEPETNPMSGVLKAAGGMTLTLGTDTVLTDMILFQEDAQNSILVPAGKTLTLTDSVVLMTKPGNDYYWKIVVEEGGKLICPDALREKLTIEEKGADEKVEIKMTVNSKIAYVNGEAKELDAEPIIRQDRTMLPVRFVAENLGAHVSWDGETSTATITGEGAIIVITIGSEVARVNDIEMKLDSPAFIENSRTYLPVRFVAEKLGAHVSWDGDTSTATLVK